MHLENLTLALISRPNYLFTHERHSAKFREHLLNSFYVPNTGLDIMGFMNQALMEGNVEDVQIICTTGEL